MEYALGECSMSRDYNMTLFEYIVILCHVANAGNLLSIYQNILTGGVGGGEQTAAGAPYWNKTYSILVHQICKSIIFQ